MQRIHAITAPAPPANRTGWPWTRMPAPPPASLSIDRWPRISLVTPSYNQAAFLEETIRSVILQGYPNLEYIVLDGGSTDGSVEILKKYEAHFSYWTSAKDGGHSPALISGFNRATGEVIGFVNSDDVLLPGALFAVGAFFATHPTVDLVVGKSLLIDAESRVIHHVMGLPPSFRSLLFWGTGGFNQPASFWKRDTMIKNGIFDTSYFFSFDYDMYFRLTREKPAARIAAYLAAFRMHPQSKTSTIRDIQAKDDAALRIRYGIERYPRPIRTLVRAFFHMRYLFLAGAFKAGVLAGLERPPSTR